MKRLQQPWWQNCLLVADEFRTRLGRSLEVPRDDRGGRRSLRLGDLEPRLLFSATPIDSAGLTGGEPVDLVVEVASSGQTNESASASDSPSQSESLLIEQETREIVFVDSAVPDLSALLDDLSRSDRNIEVFVLDADRDGVDQISEVLQGRSGVTSIHIVSHAENGNVKLGNVWLGESNLDGYAGQLASWNTSLATGADILLYGCDLASDAQGRTFLEAVSTLTGADVAASDDDTGHRSFRGDWELEYSTGAIETNVAFTTQLQDQWRGKLATITVNIFSDEVFINGNISLREAIIQANLGGGGDTIVLSSGTYLLSITGNDDNAYSGDLDIRTEIIIQGAGSGLTIIDGDGIDRVFELRTGSANLTLQDLTVRGGSTSGVGGGIHVQHADASLTLQNVIVTDNIAAQGAGIYNLGTMSLSNVVVSNNGNASTVNGGGLYIQGATTLNQVTIHNNQAGSGGGIYNNGNGTTLVNVTVSGNTATSSGGGLYNADDISITNSTFAYNTAGNGGGIRLQGAATASLLNTIVSDNAATTANSDVEGTITSLGFNLIENLTGASGFVSSDITGVSAQLGTLTNNGGATPTHSLLLGSAAINAGTASGAPTSDQRGTARLGQTDIGAFEFASIPLVVQGESLANQSPVNQQVTSAKDRGSTHSVSFAADGSYVVVWSSLNQDGSGQGVYARRFDATGNALTNEILVNQSTTGDQQWANVASASNGSFVVTWTSNHSGDQDVYFRRFNASGTAASVETRVNTTTALVQENSDISMNATTGEFVIVWSGNGTQASNVDDNGIFGQRYTSTGATSGSEFRVNTTTNGGQYDASVSMNASGQFVVVWDDAGGMRFQRFDSNGSTMSVQGTSDSSVQAGNGSVAIHDDGSFVVVWREGVAGSRDVYLQRYDNSGEEIGTVQTVNQSTTSDQASPSIAMDEDGNFIVVWEGNGTRSNHTDSSGVFAQKYLADGSRAGNEFRVNTTTNGTQERASVAILDINHFVVVWSGNGDQSGQVDASGVFSRQFVSVSPPTDITLSSSSVVENASGAVIGTVGVIDPDSGDTHDWSVDDTRFEIVSNQLRLKAGQSLNFETNPTVSVTLTATDQAGSGIAFNESFTINVSNLNESPTDITLSSTSVAENASGAVIGTVGVADPDAGDTHTWAVDDSRFEIVGNQLRLKAGQSINFETTPTVSLTLTVVDQGGSGIAFNESFTINVSNLNESPTDITLSNTSVAENASGAVIGTVGMVDPDTGDTHAWAVDDTRFEIVGNQLRLKAGQSINFETTPTVSLTLTATDQAGTGIAFNESFTINVSNLNESPTDITLSSTSVAENASGAVIGTVGVVDPDTGDTHAWAVDDTQFEIVGNQLRLKAGQSINFETTPTVSLTLTATDQAGTGIAYNESFTLNVTNLNESPTDIALSNTSVVENASDAVIGTVGVVDPDAGDTHTWAVDDSRFEIVGNQLRLRAGQSLNFETSPTVSLTLTATDQAGAGIAFNESFTINVSNLNESPTDITLSNTSVAENTSGAVIGTVGVADPDAGDTHTWAVDDTRFEIVGNQLRLMAGQSINFETNPTVSLTLTATDQTGSGIAFNESFTINVTNLNESPTDITLSNNSVVENASGAVIGTVGVVDPDAGDTHTWSVDDSRFEIVGNQLRLKAGQSINFETTPTVSLTLTATDQAGTGIAYNESFTLNVTNLNESPTDIALSNTSVVENASDAVIGTVGVVDPDAGDTHTWAVDDSRFEIVGNQLRLRAGQSLNFETSPTVSLTLTVTDQAGSGIAFNESFTLNVSNVNEAPSSVSLSNISLLERTLGAVVGDLIVTDPDAGDAYVYSVDDGRFEIVGDQLRLRADQSIDFDVETSVNVVVSVTDQSGLGLSYSEAFSVAIVNLNAAPNAVNLNGNTVQGHSTGAVVGELSVSDPNASDTHSLVVDDPRFEIVDGVLRLKSRENIASHLEPTVTLNITATDDGGLAYTATFTLNVTPPLFILPSQLPTTSPGSSTTQENQESPSEAESGSSAERRSTENESGNSSESETSNATSESQLKVVMTNGDPNQAVGGVTDATTAVNQSIDLVQQTGDEDEVVSESMIDPTQAASRSSSSSIGSPESSTVSERFSEELRRLGIVDAQSLSIQSNYALMMGSGKMWDELDQHMSEVESQIHGDLIVVGAAGAAASSFTVGVVAWGLRTGFLASGLLAQMPAWRAFDPLLIMQGAGEGDDESLEELMKRHSDALDHLENETKVTGET